MPTQFSANVAVSSRAPQRRWTALLGGVVLLAAAVFLVTLNIGFARYAVTGFSWRRTNGTVVASKRTSTPTIQFSSSDGVLHRFDEDYVLVCGGRSSFCSVRTFSPNDVVPVVYDPRAPERAFVDDWALIAGVINWFLAVGIGLFFLLILVLILVSRPIRFSMRFGNLPPAQD